MNLPYLRSIITFIIFGIFTLLIMESYLPSRKPEETIVTLKASKQPKKILIWTKIWNLPFRRFTTADFLNCSVSNCILTANHSEIAQADAVIFHAQHSDITNLTLPKVRHRFQRYVFYTLESPYITYVPKWPRFFNLTMTYRLDSDVVNRYGHYRERKASDQRRKETINYAKGKTKMAVWFVSHCVTRSKREDLVKALKKYIDVDYYGQCGKLKCPKNGVNHQNPDCMKTIANKYKFYLSLENSLCPDYVTEKLFVPLLYDIVPVVYGGINYSRFAPPHSFIDVMHFKDVKELADYLILLDRNDEMYNRYFDWKKKYVVSNLTTGWCDLCEKLNREDDPPKIYDDVSQWWNMKKCVKSENIAWFGDKLLMNISSLSYYEQFIILLRKKTLFK